MIARQQLRCRPFSISADGTPEMAREQFVEIDLGEALSSAAR
jgi:hypothetical protein